MPIEQEPLKIEIPLEDEPAMKPQQHGAGVSATVTDTSRQLATRARTAWDSEQRRQSEAVVRAGAKHGAAAAKVGLIRGLHWLSARLSDLASRLGDDSSAGQQ